MLNNNQLKVKDIRNIFINKYLNKDYIIDEHGNKTIEIINANFIADEAYIIKQPNINYIRKELKWYLSQSLNIYDLDDNPPHIWKQVCDKNGVINSNYGYLIFSEKNYNQFDNVLNALINNKNTRRAIMIYIRPSMHYDFNINGMNDFVCTIANQFFIRENKLISIYMMRSNDAVFGYNNDYAWAKFVYNILYKKLKKIYKDIERHPIIWIANSLHIYERHFKFISKFIENDKNKIGENNNGN